MEKYELDRIPVLRNWSNWLDRLVYLTTISTIIVIYITIIVDIYATQVSLLDKFSIGHFGY